MFHRAVRRLSNRTQTCPLIKMVFSVCKYCSIVLFPSCINLDLVVFKNFSNTFKCCTFLLEFFLNLSDGVKDCLLCNYCTDLQVLRLTSLTELSVLCPQGLGWGLVFTPMVATVMANFTRRRTLALGLGFSSIGLSSFAFNPLFQLLVETYAWRGALLIIGGLSLNIVPCGALIRPQPRPKSPAKVNQITEHESSPA